MMLNVIPKHVKMTLECQIFIKKSTGLYFYFCPFSVAKPTTAKSDECSVFKSVMSSLNSPLIIFGKKMEISYFFTKEVSGLLGIDITDLNRSIIWAMAVFIALRGVWFSKWKWWKVTGITQYFPNENLTF